MLQTSGHALSAILSFLYYFQLSNEVTFYFNLLSSYLSIKLWQSGFSRILNTPDYWIQYKTSTEKRIKNNDFEKRSFYYSAAKITPDI